MKYTKQEIAEAREALLADLKPGMTIYTILRHVGRSGMRRHISLLVVNADGPRYYNYSAARVLERSTPKGPQAHDSIVINGCGMDMGFELVYSLSQRLFGDGYALKQAWL